MSIPNRSGRSCSRRSIARRKPRWRRIAGTYASVKTRSTSAARPGLAWRVMCRVIIGVSSLTRRRRRGTWRNGSEHRPAGDRDPDAVERRRRRDEQAPQVAVSPREVRRVLGNANHPEARRLGVEDVDPAGACAVEVAFAVDLHAVGSPLAFPLRFGPYPPVRQGPVWADIEDTDVAAVRVVDEQAALIEGETQPIRPVEVVDEQGEGSPVGLDAIHSLEAHHLAPRHPVELDPP